MAAITSEEKRKVESLKGDSTLSLVLRYGLLAIFDAIFLMVIYALSANGNFGLAIVLGVAVVGMNLIFFIPALYPLRWMAPGLFFVTILVIYPIFYTVYTAFTNYGNYGDGHLFTKQESIYSFVNGRQYLYPPEGALTYNWSLYRLESDPNQYALWLNRTNEDGITEYAFAPLDAPIEDVQHDAAEPPASYNGYVLMSRAELAPVLGTIQSLIFGEGDDTAAIRTVREVARPLAGLYVYDEAQNALINQQTGVAYVANDTEGVFASAQGEKLRPGYRVTVGFSNFTRFFNDPRLRGPLVTIFIWTIMFAFLSVFTTFVAGLFMALILNDARIPGKKIIRSLLIIPYAIPGIIGIMVWRGLLNPNFGLINETLIGWFGEAGKVEWFGDASWARIAIIIVNLWLGYPYMMLICSGALQAIPSDIYEAAAVDGAKPNDRFWKITLPLLLVTIGPLLIASFVFNFNNYLIIEALNNGNPPIANSPTPAGYTDILISYTYSLAFGNDRGADYGYASAITILIFLLVAGVTMVQYRLTKTWEEVGENV